MKSQWHRILVAGCCVLAFGILAARAQSRPARPPVLAVLLPRAAIKVSGEGWRTTLWRRHGWNETCPLVHREPGEALN